MANFSMTYRTIELANEYVNLNIRALQPIPGWSVGLVEDQVNWGRYIELRPLIAIGDWEGSIRTVISFRRGNGSPFRGQGDTNHRIDCQGATPIGGRLAYQVGNSTCAQVIVSPEVLEHFTDSIIGAVHRGLNHSFKHGFNVHIYVEVQQKPGKTSKLLAWNNIHHKMTVKAGVLVGQKAGFMVAKAALQNGVKPAIAKSIGVSVAKKVPFLGLFAGICFAAARGVKGDLVGAGGEIVSGALACFPGYGTGASLAVDCWLFKRDFDAAKEEQPKS